MEPDMPTEMKKPRFPYKAPFAGGILHFGLKKTGPRTFQAVGIFLHPGLPFQPQFRADVEVAVKVNDPSGVLTQVGSVVSEITKLFRVAENAVGKAAGSGRGQG